MTVLDAIIQSLSRAGEHNRGDQVAPVVILWPDTGRRWDLALREDVPPLLARRGHRLRVCLDVRSG